MLAVVAVTATACGPGPDADDDPGATLARTPAPASGGPGGSASTRASPGPVDGPPSAVAEPHDGSPDATSPSPGTEDDVAQQRPGWIGTRVLPLRPDGYGEIRPTPAQLRDRRLPPPPGPLAPPERTDFAATITEVPDDVLERSTWGPDCPVRVDDLRYVTLSFWGFDDAPHTGEVLVHAAAAADLVQVFERLYEARFPIEEMRVVAPEELDAPPTGDGNNTTAFVCRPVRGATSWSQHAYGLAIDVNPFHNPYQRDDLVLPELASAYTDRAWARPGMIVEGDVVTTAFDAIGWGWGDRWSRPVDPMHFSADGS